MNSGSHAGPPRLARRRSSASAAASAAYRDTARPAARPPLCRARAQASDRAGMDARAGTSAGASQPAEAYTASSAATARSRRRRIRTASHSSTPNTGTITEPYTTANPYSPNREELFHSACVPMASARPAAGSPNRRARPAPSVAAPKPSPLSTVNSGCANGETMTRTKKVAAVIDSSTPVPLARSCP